MEKMNVVLVLFKRKALKGTLKKLNRDNVNVVAIMTDGEEKSFKIDGEKVPRISFRGVRGAVKKYKDSFWLISDYMNDAKLF